MDERGIKGKRIKTRHIGVYYRFSERRFLPNGKPDKCYDIHYKKGKQYTFEKVGWTSEGFTVEDAIRLRNIRVRALRHPELVQEQEAKSVSDTTINDIWEVYKNKWLPTLKRSQKHISMYSVYIEPVFGSRTVKSITPLDVQTFITDLLNTTIKKEPHTKLKPATIQMVLKFFKSLFAKGALWGLIDSSQRDPVGKIDIKNTDFKRERYLTPQEVERLLDACQHMNCKLYYVALISLHTGMRLGEILSLTGQQIDVESGTISLNGKTGRRTAYIDDDLKSVFCKLLPDGPAEFLFRNNAGQPIKPNTFSVAFGEIISAIGLNKGITDDAQKVVFHTLRHTFCSWLAIKGVPLYTIGQLVGHSSSDMTQRYAKLSPDSKREALKGINLTMQNIK